MKHDIENHPAIIEARRDLINLRDCIEDLKDKHVPQSAITYANLALAKATRNLHNALLRALKDRDDAMAEDELEEYQAAGYARLLTDVLMD